MPTEARHEIEATLEQQERQPLDILREQVELLLVDGDGVAAQLRQHGDHQSSFYGHFHDRCETCSILDKHNETAKNVRAAVLGIFPEQLSESSSDT